MPGCRLPSAAAPPNPSPMKKRPPQEAPDTMEWCELNRVVDQ